MRIVSPKEYIETPRPKIGWLTDGLIPKPGYMLLLGPEKTGKSFLAWDIAAKIASGRDLMGYKTRHPRRVLYVQLDTKEAAWSERLRKFSEAGIDLDIPNLALVHPDDMTLPLLITTPKGQAFMRSALHHAKPELVIIDVLRELHQDDENDSTAMKKVFDAMEPLFNGYSVILIHHTRKMTVEDEAAPDPRKLARGSNYITGRVDGYWLLYGPGPNRKLYFESRFQESTLMTARQDPNTGLFSFPDLDGDSQLAESLQKLCGEFPARAHSELWKVALDRYGMKRSTCYRVWSRTTCNHVKCNTSTVPQTTPDAPVSGGQ